MVLDYNMLQDHKVLDHNFEIKYAPGPYLESILLQGRIQEVTHPGGPSESVILAPRSKVVALNLLRRGEKNSIFEANSCDLVHYFCLKNLSLQK